jgi:lycopene cyclase domain-containing protein
MNDILESKFLYAGLMFLSLAYPLAQSFEWRIQYFKKWKYLFIGIAAMLILFIPWDIYFTMKGIWWFNEKYILGTKIFSLPIEEWLFFLIIPFACIFIYEVLNYFIKKDVLKLVARPFYAISAILLMILAFMYSDRLYTLITFGLTSLSLILLVVMNPVWRGRFLLMFVVSLIPFLLINGVLTGSFISEAVVNYNPTAITGFRINTIPVEDSVYSFLMLLIVVTIYEWRKNQPSVERT